MARPASTAVAGFYKFPTELLARTAKLVRCGEGEHAVFDPCAGEGEAVFTIASLCCGAEERPDVYACEMEATRHAVLARAGKAFGYGATVVHGDAFTLRLSTRSRGPSVLVLNSPYDHDREMGRLEERWLRRFAQPLAVGGALLFVVPFYALAASAVTLATLFDGLACFRFPGVFFDAFKQVVLVARRRAPLLGPDPVVETQVRAWSADATVIPELPENPSPVIVVDGAKRNPGVGFDHAGWTCEELDVRRLCEVFRPWASSDRGGRLVDLPNVIPADPFDTLLAPRFPLGTVPRPAHLAAGLASGVLSGVRLTPTVASSGLPEILVRGTFSRRFVAIQDKLNKEGEKVGELQAQVPELELVALDLKAGSYHTLRSSTDTTGARAVGDMTAGDLLASYGRDLLASLRDRCPALYDQTAPGAADTLPQIPGARALFTAQEHAARGLVRVMRRPDRTAILLGEIGTGKTSCSLRAIHALGAPGALVMAPPHVIAGFAAQVPAILHDARVVVLDDVASVDAWMADEDVRFTVVLVSRETAKLGHAWAGVEGGRCPACGAKVSEEPGELARRRLTCSGRRWQPTGPLGRLAASVAAAVHLATPKNVNAQALVPGRIARAMRRKQTPDRAAVAWPAARDRLRALVPVLVALLGSRPMVSEALAWLLCAIGDRELMAETARTVFVGSLFDAASYGTGRTFRDVARSLLLLAGPAGAAVASELRAVQIGRSYYGDGDPWQTFDTNAAEIATGKGVWAAGGWTVADKSLKTQTHEAAEFGSPEAARHLLDVLVGAGQQGRTRECGEPLFQAVPEPRRVPLAHYVAKRYGKALRARGWALIIDEAHEYAAEASAQALAAQQLLGLRLPTIVMTGSVMNGYAESLFNLLWWTSAAFRAEFDRKDRGEFVRRFGYVKQVVEQRDHEGKKVVFGTHTDRVETVTRESGQAPGVLPTLLLRHLLPGAVTLQMADIESELPVAREILVPVRAEGDLLAGYRTLERKLLDQIKRDRFVPDLAGRLFGQLAELPAALDRLTSDVTGAEYAVRYPDGAGADAGKVVVAVAALPAETITPKEQALLDTARAELAEGRNMVVFAWHLDVIPRLARLLGALGRVAVLDCNKVAPTKRDAWIAREVAKKTRFVLVNPVGVSTGINSMVPYFSTDWWHENPACNPQILRQAKGRTRRIGQTQEKRSYFPVYEETAQAVAHRLLLHKVGIGEAADGLDATAALQAAGVGVGAVDLTAAQDLGRALFEALTAGETRMAA